MNIFRSRKTSLESISLVVDVIPNMVLNEINVDLDCPFMAEEFCVVVFGMSPTKAPGYDGMLALFFQKFWYVIGQDVTLAYIDLLNGNCKEIEINRNLIS